MPAPAAAPGRMSGSSAGGDGADEPFTGGSRPCSTRWGCPQLARMSTCTRPCHPPTDGVLVDERAHELGCGHIAALSHRHVPLLDIKVAAELLPAHVHCKNGRHEEGERSVRCSKGTAALLLPSQKVKACRNPRAPCRRQAPLSAHAARAAQRRPPTLRAHDQVGLADVLARLLPRLLPLLLQAQGCAQGGVQRMMPHAHKKSGAQQSNQSRWRQGGQRAAGGGGGMRDDTA